MSFTKLRGFVMGLAALALSSCAPAAAQTPQPVQWQYSFDNAGAAVATYPGSVNAPYQTSSNTFSGTSLGTPATGYFWNFNLANINTTVTVNGAGWNQSTSTNDGRTAIANNVAFVTQNGNGDAGALQFHRQCFLLDGAGDHGE